MSGLIAAKICVACMGSGYDVMISYNLTYLPRPPLSEKTKHDCMDQPSDPQPGNSTTILTHRSSYTVLVL